MPAALDRRIRVGGAYNAGVSRKLSSLGPDELLREVHSAELDEVEVLEVLRNPYCSVEIALLVAQRPKWTTSHGVRELLVGFRGFPFADAMNLLPTLPWTSLLQLAQAPKTPPVVRRQAERKLLDRLAKMALGEKVALARRAHRPLFASLIATGDLPVLVALLDNPRLVENDMLVLVNTRDLQPQFFQAIVRHHRWGGSYGVRRAVAECPRTPYPLALSALVQLNPCDLRSIVDRGDLPERLRAAAQALLLRKGLER